DGRRRCWKAPAHVGYGLLRQLVDCCERELTIREGLTRLRSKAKIRPHTFIAEAKPLGLFGGSGGTCTHVVEDRLIEAGTAAAYLVRHIDRMAVADEVFVPSHSPIGRRFPALAGQRRAMNHHDRKLLVDGLRHHVPHVHLIDRDVPVRTQIAELISSLRDPFTADIKAALRFEHERLRRDLHVAQRLCARVTARVEKRTDSHQELNRCTTKGDLHIALLCRCGFGSSKLRNDRTPRAHAHYRRRLRASWHRTRSACPRRGSQTSEPSRSRYALHPRFRTILYLSCRSPWRTHPCSYKDCRPCCPQASTTADRSVRSGRWHRSASGRAGCSSCI